MRGRHLIRFNFNRFVLSSFIGIVTLPFIQSSARAIVINSTAGEETALLLGAPFTAVTQIFLQFQDGQSLCSGSLINPFTVLTAQHCFVGDFEFADVRFFDTNQEVFASIPTIGEPFVLDDTDIQDGTEDLFDGTDIAILTLAEPAPQSVTPLRLLSDTDDLLGSTFTMVGFGDQGEDAIEDTIFIDNLRWAAENTIDVFGDSLFGSDFDDGTSESNSFAEFGSSPIPLFAEGTTAVGDSGGPLLVNRGGEFLIAGVLSGGFNPTFNPASSFGDVSFWTGTAAERSFIEKQGGKFADIPEPSSSLILLALGSLGAMRTRKRWYQGHCQDSVRKIEQKTHIR